MRGQSSDVSGRCLVMRSLGPGGFFAVVSAGGGLFFQENGQLTMR